MGKAKAEEDELFYQGQLVYWFDATANRWRAGKVAENQTSGTVRVFNLEDCKAACEGEAVNVDHLWLRKMAPL